MVKVELITAIKDLKEEPINDFYFGWNMALDVVISLIKEEMKDD